MFTEPRCSSPKGWFFTFSKRDVTLELVSYSFWDVMLSVLLLFWLRTEHKRFEQMKKIEFKTTISLCNFNDFIQWFTLRPRENLNLGAINIKNKLLWNNFTISYPSYKHSNYLGLNISAPLFFYFLKCITWHFEHFLDNAFLVRRKTFPNESYLMLFLDKLD